MNLKTRCEGKDIQVINKKALNRAFFLPRVKLYQEII